ncbi:alpha/beta hydrolase [Streptomyces bohaiensis]|uniref:alpha/beta hydrolase n=1 Tax=Streptomyces bohaiensis TaxID=1431344 RepID=UPI003B76ECD1
MALIRTTEIPVFSGNLETLQEATRRLGKDADDIYDSGDSLHLTFQRIGNHYSAPETADLLATTVPVRENGESVRQSVARVALAVDDYARDAQTISARLDALRTRAAEIPSVPEDDPDFARHEQESEEIRGDVAALVADFARMEEETVRTINSALPYGQDHGMPGPWAPGYQPPWHFLAPPPPLPCFTSPEAANRWWQGLSAQEQERWIQGNPAGIGALDGIPVVDRDRANRIVFDRWWERDRPDLALREHRAAEPEKYREFRHYSGIARYETDAWKEWNERRKELKALVQVRDRLDETGGYTPPANESDRLPPSYLLHFDPSGRGRIAIATGNPDTADHTAVLVPGTGAELRNVGGDMKRTEDLWRASNRMSPSHEQVSTITWIGYETPPEIMFDATKQEYADDGAPLLNSFLDGLDATRTATGDRNTTVIAHSYGSTTTGTATQQREHPISADSIIAVGSPGMTVGSAAELGIGADNVYAMQAPFHRDQVAEGGRWFHGETNSGWKTRWGFAPYYDVDLVPNVPSDEDFGARRLANDSVDHSGYWAGELNLDNQAAVIIGRPERATYE